MVIYELLTHLQYFFLKLYKKNKVSYYGTPFLL